MSQVQQAIVIPRGRSAAEKRLGAIAALHSPIVDEIGFVHGVNLGRRLYCAGCSNRYDTVPWPCATARLMGPWPGEVPE